MHCSFKKIQRTFFLILACAALSHTTAFTKNITAQRIKQNSLFHEKRTIKKTDVYDLCVLSQNHPLNQATYFRVQFGCGFHALKNLMLLAPLMHQKELSQLDSSLFLEQKLFAYLFETGGPKLATEQEKLAHSPAWYFVTRAYREKKFGKTMAHHDRPPTSTDELTHLCNQILQKKALTCPGSDDAELELLKKTQIIEFLPRKQPEERGGSTLHVWQLAPNDVITLLEHAQLLRNNTSLTLPYLIAYPHPWGRHWITVLVNKINNKIEVIFADSWRVEKQRNWVTIQRLLEFLLESEETIKKYKNKLHMNHLIEQFS